VIAAAFDDEVGARTARRGRRVAEREPVTAVFSRRVKPGREAEYAGLAEGVTAASASFRGQLAATILHDGRDYALVYTFESPDTLDAWLDSDIRRAFVVTADKLAESHRRLQPKSGLETWFTLPGKATIKPPPRWKMWLVSFVVLYPLVVCFQEWLAPVLKSWPLFLRSAIFPLVLLTTMTYGVMPVVTRMTRRWLYR
jgi:uncharacterized protein